MYIENSSISRYNAILSFYTKPRKPLRSKEKFVLYLNLMTACNPDISLELKSSYGLARFNKDAKIRKYQFGLSVGVFIIVAA